MHKIKLLIKKFWETKLSGDESKELDSLLQNNDLEFRSELESQFHESIARKEKMDAGIAEESRGKIFSIGWKSIWLAAAAILIAIVGIQFYNQNGNDKNEYLDNKLATRKYADTASLVQVKNTKTSDIEIHLPDGSVVILAPQSTLSYNKFFDKTERNINLNGKAYFKVAKDKKRPFTVFSNELATTALGTEFEVNTFIRNNIVVKLFEGKVSVRSTGKSNAFDVVYLSPGQTVTLSLINNIAKVGSFKEERNIGIVKKNRTKDPDTNYELNFSNEPLKNVFDKLGTVYNIRIKYNEDQLKGLYFTGYTLKSDSVKNIISLISNMNGLRAQDMGNHIVIQKK